MEISVEEVVLPNKPLTNIELLNAANKLGIPNFRGVFQRDALPKRSRKGECDILNLDDSLGGGSHWTAWYACAYACAKADSGGVHYYFDSFGIQPPLELVEFLKPPIFYNTEEVQPRDQVFCGHLCLYVLKELSKGKGLQEIINTLT